MNTKITRILAIAYATVIARTPTVNIYKNIKEIYMKHTLNILTNKFTTMTKTKKRIHTKIN